MVKLTICARRCADLTHEQFDTYWRDQHGPLIRATTEFSRHVRGYVQCHGVGSAGSFGVESDWDGIAELWFDDVESMQRAFAEPRYLEVIRPDELKFADIEACVSYVSEELKII